MAYADWKAPQQDSERLVWPAAPSLPKAAAENARSLGDAHHVLIQRCPLPELRKIARQFIGHDHERLLIATGHQTELWHPGVWAKNALIDAVARAADGFALHLAVDTDAPKHLNIRWPGQSIPITDDARLADAPWSALLDPPTPTHLAEIESALQSASADFGYEPVAGQWIQSLRLAVLEGLSGSDLSKSIAAASHQLDWSLDLHYSIATLSPLLNSLPWLALVHHLLSGGPEFVRDYNDSLASYRSAQGIVSQSRPMPNLAVRDEQIEMPFWTDEVGQTPRRHRTTLTKRDGRWWLVDPASSEAIELDPTLPADQAASKLGMFLTRHRLRITPRALTLMIFMRLLVADLFVHGIGGGRYDQITDLIIRKHFGITPPMFAVSTATLYLPQALNRERVCMPCLLRDGHHLKHAALGERKQQLVEAIAAAPRNSLERAKLFSTMHRELRAARESDKRLSNWRDLMEASKTRLVEDATVFDREVFYAIQPRHRLESLIADYRADLNV
jgi:hypothetical protein